METITITINGRSHNVTRTARGFIVSIKGNTRILSNDLLYNGRLYNIKNVFSAESTAWKWIYKEISAAATDYSLNDLINA